MSALLIAELNAAYASAIDNDRLEEWPDFFVEDCLYKITSVENHRRGYAAGVVYANSRAMLRDRVTALRRANIYERQRYRHIIGLPLVIANGAGGIAAETPFLVVRIMRDGSSDLFATGVYLDTDCGKRRVVSGSSSASRSATARISIRCWPFRSRFPGVQSRPRCVGECPDQAQHPRGAAASAAEYSGAGLPGALTGARRARASLPHRQEPLPP